jgi:predicted transcriptional regulator
MDLYQTVTLPVLDADGRLCGVLTDDAIWSAHCEGNGTEAAATPSIRACSLYDQVRADEIGNLSVSRYMISPAGVIGEDEDLGLAYRLLIGSPYDRLYVLDARDKVIGTLSRIDLLQAAFESAP